MATLFTRIIQGDIPCHRLYEDDRYFAFLDINPINPGHTLLIPKVEVDKFFDLEDDLLAGMMPVAKRLSQALEATVTCKRVGLIVLGLEVPHAHLHLVPISGEGELSFSRARRADDDELARLAEQIRANLPAD